MTMKGDAKNKIVTSESRGPWASSPGRRFR